MVKTPFRCNTDSFPITRDHFVNVHLNLAGNERNVLIVHMLSFKVLLHMHFHTGKRKEKRKCKQKQQIKLFYL